MPFRRIRERRRRERIAHDLYSSIITQSRQPQFYLSGAVPDTLDGRFELIVLHAFLVMRRLNHVAAPVTEAAKTLSQALFDLMFDDMDQNLRELGVGDMSVGKKVKQMAQAFYGRVAAYEDGVAAGGASLAEALQRNLYGTLESAPASATAMADYVLRQDSLLSKQEDGVILEGKVVFAETGDLA
jgi:cytochrome b pre-mRNA-processing protein 3